MILTMTPDPIEISATRVYMDRGLTMATFGLYCAGVQEQARDTLALPDSLKVAVQLDDGTVVEAEQAETLHCQITLRVGCAPRTEGWTVDKADLPDMAIQKMPTDCDTTPAVYYTTSADPEELDVTKKLRNLTIEELIEDPLQGLPPAAPVRSKPVLRIVPPKKEAPLHRFRKKRKVTCAVCSTEFEALDVKAKFCSNRCKQADRYARRKKPVLDVKCKRCGVDICTEDRRIKYCSDDCRTLARLFK